MKALFLGAGASYECGMPLVWEFTNILRRALLKRLDTNLFDFNSAPSLRQKFVDILSNPRFQYEQMVGELETIYLAGGEQAQFANNLYRQLVECVQGLLIEDQHLTTGFFSERVKDYAGIKDLVSRNPCLHVFSLNHDVNFEEICKYHGVPCRDGFYGADDRKYANVARFNKLTTTQMEAGDLHFFKSGEIGVNLIKLHGSLDIFAVEDKKLYLKCAPRDSEGIGGHVAEITKLERHGVEVAQLNQCRATGEVMVRDSDGQIQFLRRSLLSGTHKFSKRIEQIAPIAFFNEFKQRLASVDELDVIGYGFGDGHVNAVIADWMRGDVRVNIFDPYRQVVPEALAASGDKVQLIQEGLTDYLHRYGGKETLSAMQRAKLNDIRADLKRRRESAWTPSSETAS
jgi:hypothetical protein